VDAERRNTVDINAEERLEDAVEDYTTCTTGPRSLRPRQQFGCTATIRSCTMTLTRSYPSHPNTELTLHAAGMPGIRLPLLPSPASPTTGCMTTTPRELPGLPLISPLTLDKQGLFFLTRRGAWPSTSTCLPIPALTWRFLAQREREVDHLRRHHLQRLPACTGCCL